MILELLLDIVIVIIPIRLTFEVTAADNNTDTHQPAVGARGRHGEDWKIS